MFLSLIGLTLAQDPTTDTTPDPQYAAETHIEFGYTRVDGKLVGPDGKFLPERPKAVFNPLITLRVNFDDEMDQSVALVK